MYLRIGNSSLGSLSRELVCLIENFFRARGALGRVKRLAGARAHRSLRCFYRGPRSGGPVSFCAILGRPGLMGCGSAQGLHPWPIPSSRIPPCLPPPSAIDSVTSSSPSLLNLRSQRFPVSWKTSRASSSSIGTRCYLSSVGIRFIRDFASSSLASGEWRQFDFGHLITRRSLMCGGASSVLGIARRAPP